MNDFVVMPIAYLSAFITGFMSAFMLQNRKIEKFVALTEAQEDCINEQSAKLQENEETIEELTEKNTKLNEYIRSLKTTFDEYNYIDMPKLV
jgi:predicted nuclease with TOPRIM domain